jgi:hypothetical protein
VRVLLRPADFERTCQLALTRLAAQPTDDLARAFVLTWDTVGRNGALTFLWTHLAEDDDENLDLVRRLGRQQS